MAQDCAERLGGKQPNGRIWIYLVPGSKQSHQPYQRHMFMRGPLRASGPVLSEISAQTRALKLGSCALSGIPLSLAMAGNKAVSKGQSTPATWDISARAAFKAPAHDADNQGP